MSLQDLGNDWRTTATGNTYHNLSKLNNTQFKTKIQDMVKKQSPQPINYEEFFFWPLIKDNDTLVYAFENEEARDAFKNWKTDTNKQKKSWGNNKQYGSKPNYNSSSNGGYQKRFNSAPRKEYTRKHTSARDFVPHVNINDVKNHPDLDVILEFGKDFEKGNE